MKRIETAAVASRRRRQEKGSALLVVLVFAAIIAIMLYRELPIAAFEAQRQKEQLLVSRGNQYKRGVKLFVRKLGRFPSTIDELENTNRMRFLRHRFVDPLTGKEDWRLIHAGPGGVILDSKVAPAGANKNAGALGQGAAFAGFNNSFSGDKEATDALAAANTPSPGMRQRPAATQNAGGGAPLDPLAIAGGNPEPTDNPNGGNNNQPIGPTANPAINLDPVSGQQLPPTMQQGAGNGGATFNNAALNNSAQSTANAVTTLADQLNNTNPQTPQQSPATSANVTSTGLANTSSFNTGSAFGSSPNSPANSFGNQGPNQNQLTAAGGIAGVASNAEGKSIKTVHDQSKYKLWEFYYDMKAEQNQGAAGGLGQQPNANGTTTNGTSNAFGQNNNNGFGQNSGSSFGSGFSIGNSGNGNGASGSTPPVTPVNPPPSQQ